MLVKKRQQQVNQSRSGFSGAPHPLTNFEIQKHQNEPKFKCIYSRNNLP